MGGQEHFYLETHNVVVVPHEDDELEVISSTQCVNDVQVLTILLSRLQTRIFRWRSARSSRFLATRYA